MTEDPRLEELIPLYALGVLEGDELREAERLIGEGSPRAVELLKQYEGVTSLLPYSAGAASPGPGVRREIMEYARKSARRRRAAGEAREGGLAERLRPFFFGLGGALAAAVIVFLFVNNLSLRGTLREEKAVVGDLRAKVSGQEEEIKSLKNLLAEKEGMVGGLEAKLASLEEITEFMEDQEIVLIRMERSDPGIRAAGRVLWDTEESDALLYCLDLPKAPPGKTYQWWVLVGGVPKSVGVFDVDEEGDSVILIDSLKKYGRIEKFIVTVEPDGGARKPTGKELLRGQSI
ncbi:MAG: anti-sigma factor [Thermodesulfobacteriota bacterium]